MPWRAVALVAVLLASSLARAAPERRESLLYANCARDAGEYVGRYRGRLVLHEALLAKMGDRDAAIRTSIEHQLRYLWGHYRNDAAAHAAVQLTLSAEPPQIEIVSQRRAPYGRDLPLPYTERAERLRLDDAYSVAGVARGRVGRGDPALVVEYQIAFKVTMCGRAGDPPPAARVPLPADPWLAYWYVPKRHHRPLRIHQDRAVTNPCADDDFADLPHPYYYWYDWLATRHGPDDDGHPFDCRAWLKEGDHYAHVDVTFERAAVASHDLSRLRRQLEGASLTATILIGVVDHTVRDVQPAVWAAALGDGEGDALRARAQAVLDRWPDGAPHEAGTRSFLGVLTTLGEVMHVERHRARVDGAYVAVDVEGRLARSARPLRVRLYVGPTDIFGPVPPDHWRLLRRALAEDQLVVYWGHSGIGENFRLAQIEKHTALSHEAMSAELRRSPLRLVAFLSCYSYMYFGQDLLAAGAERDDGAYFIFTGIEQAEHESGPLAVLALVDEVLRADNVAGRLDRLPRLGDDEFWLLKEVGKSR